MHQAASPPARISLAADPALAVAVLLAAALTVGGGGVSSAFGNLAVQLLAIAILALHPAFVLGFVRRAPRPLVALVGASLLLPLVQLIPLPPTWWPHLPGRELVAQSFDLTGGRGWFPLSVAPARTLVAFLGTLAPATIIILGCGLPPERLAMLQRAVVGLAVVVALFGATHLLNTNWGDLYAARRALPGVIVGTFADRNAAALFFVAALLLLIGLPARPRTASALALHIAAGAFVALCVVLTGSRTGMVLLAAPALLLVCRAGAGVLGDRPGARSTGRSAAWAAGAVLIALLAAAAVLSSGRGQASLARFDERDGMRAEMREDARFAAARYWPAGSGMGTFDEVFQIDESLEYVSPRRAGRAHMDYLELAIEAGIAGLLLAAAWLAWAAWRGLRSVTMRGAWAGRAGGLIVAAVAAQSLLEFPLRSQALLCVAAFAVVLLARPPIAGSRPGPDR